MKIGLDARMVQNSGVGSYLQGLIDVWARDTAQRPLTLFGEPGFLRFGPFRAVEFDAPIYSLREQWAGPRLFSSEALDLLHVPHYNIPILYRRPLVVTIHDIIHLLYPRMAKRVGAGIYARVMLNAAVKKAKRIITVSEQTKNDLLNHLHADPDKIKVVYPAVSPEFARAPETVCRPTLSKHRLEPGFILFVGDVRPHKNVAGLLAAYRLLRNSRADCPPVVIVGKTERVPESLRQEDLNVRWLGSLPRKELIHLYSSAGALAFPTLYEGFGLPPLEAMACGCPVVVSRCGALSESVGEAGLYVDAESPASIAEGLDRLLWDSSLKQQLIEQGRTRISLFSWEKAAAETWKVYEDTLA